jgi:hypothetical protein
VRGITSNRAGPIQSKKWRYRVRTGVILSEHRKEKRTLVEIELGVLLALHKEVMAGTDRVELVPDAEVAGKRTLHGRFLAGNGQGESSRDVFDYVFAEAVVVDRGEES